MMDIHSHILPEVDDGARNLPMALDMLRMAIDAGVNTQVLTPHIHPGTFDNTRSSLEARFRRFVDEVADAGLAIELRLASEVRIGPEIMPMLMRDEIPLLDNREGSRMFLLEFPPDDIPFGSENLVRWLRQRGYLPVIAHPERNRTFTRQPEKLEAYIQLGCPLQLTAGSFRGKFGSAAGSFALELLARDLPCFIATDCHNVTSRCPDLDKALPIIAQHTGTEKLRAMVHADAETRM